MCVLHEYSFWLTSSFDARSTDFEKGSHWLDEKSLGSRAYFQASATPPSLIINDAQDSDSGIYRCRVDFHKSPTKNSRVQLKIIRKSQLIHRLHILIKINDFIVNQVFVRIFFLMDEYKYFGISMGAQLDFVPIVLWFSQKPHELSFWIFSFRFFFHYLKNEIQVIKPEK